MDPSDGVLIGGVVVLVTVIALIVRRIVKDLRAKK